MPHWRGIGRGSIVVSDLFKKAKGLFGREPEPKPAPVKKTVAEFHAVGVIPGPRPCAAAEALRGKRFLSRQAPVLPLKACDRGDCQCRYAHYEDRRMGPRRARDIGVAIGGHDGPDNRAKLGRGRRKSDVW
jgi:hypothetical protein